MEGAPQSGGAISLRPCPKHQPPPLSDANRATWHAPMQGQGRSPARLLLWKPVPHWPPSMPEPTPEPNQSPLNLLFQERPGHPPALPPATLSHELPEPLEPVPLGCQPSSDPLRHQTPTVWAPAPYSAHLLPMSFRGLSFPEDGPPSRLLQPMLSVSCYPPLYGLCLHLPSPWQFRCRLFQEALPHRAPSPSQRWVLSPPEFHPFVLCPSRHR